MDPGVATWGSREGLPLPSCPHLLCPSSSPPASLLSFSLAPLSFFPFLVPLLAYMNLMDSSAYWFLTFAN